MSETLRNQGKVVESRNVLGKLIGIWNDTLYRKLRESAIDDPDELSKTEAFDNLKNGLVILESELGQVHPLIGECQQAIGLIEISRGNFPIAAEYLQKAHDILNNSAGQFDRRTEIAQDILKYVRIRC